MVQSQIPAMTENMPFHVFEYIEASLTLCTPRLDVFSPAYSKRAYACTSLCTALVYLWIFNPISETKSHNNSSPHRFHTNIVDQPAHICV